MAKQITAFVYWRGVLVQMQAALANPALSTAQSSFGWSLLQALQQHGAAYDVFGDDSPLNLDVFSTGTCQPYMDAATPLFDELDRQCRFVYQHYINSALNQTSDAYLAGLWGQAFGLTPFVDQFSVIGGTPAPLVFLWQTATDLWTSLTDRVVAANQMLVVARDFVPTLAQEALALEVQLLVAIDAANPYLTPPPNPNPAKEVESVLATNHVNNTMSACTTWLGTLAFQ